MGKYRVLTMYSCLAKAVSLGLRLAVGLRWLRGLPPPDAYEASHPYSWQASKAAEPVTFDKSRHRCGCHLAPEVIVVSSRYRRHTACQCSCSMLTHFSRLSSERRSALPIRMPSSRSRFLTPSPSPGAELCSRMSLQSSCTGVRKQRRMRLGAQVVLCSAVKPLTRIASWLWTGPLSERTFRSAHNTLEVWGSRQQVALAPSATQNDA